MKNIWLVLGSLAVTCIAVIAVAFLFTKKANAPVLPSDPQTVVGDARHSKGSTEAKVTIVEFSDLQCPACKAAQPLVSAILTEASESAKLVYRHYPLRNLHKNAEAAAKAAEAAGLQGKFFEYHDKLFETQSDWEEESDPSSKFEQYAKDLSLDLEKWKGDRESQEVKDKIAKDEQDGNTLGISGTPSFFVNNMRTDVQELPTVVQNLLSQE